MKQIFRKKKKKLTNILRGKTVHSEMKFEKIESMYLQIKIIIQNGIRKTEKRVKNTSAEK